jgi:hypothetical protein
MSSALTIKYGLIATAIISASVIGYFLYKKYYSSETSPTVTKEDLIKDCKDKCETWQKVCDKGCSKLEEGNQIACKFGCKVTNTACNATCTGKSGLRNGSLHHINVWDKNKKWLTRLTPWESRNLHLEPSDFPIYASRCPDIESPDCDKNNQKWVLKKEDPGCYILWGGGLTELYTTRGACI